LIKEKDKKKGKSSILQGREIVPLLYKKGPIGIAQFFSHIFIMSLRGMK
jgi:hypothetical protein